VLEDVLEDVVIGGGLIVVDVEIKFIVVLLVVVSGDEIVVVVDVEGIDSHELVSSLQI
jgi:hypothetical protein